MERDRQSLDVAVAALGPSRAVGSISRADIQGLVHAWRTRPAASTVRRMYSTVSALFDYAAAAEVLRSVAASAMVAAGVNVKTAQTRLGYASAALTLQVYARASAAADRRAADLVGEHFQPRDARR